MDYMTLKEASEIWGVTPRWINYYCSSGRIPGAVKMGTVCLIPKGAQKPADRRLKAHAVRMVKTNEAHFLCGGRFEFNQRSIFCNQETRL